MTLGLGTGTTAVHAIRAIGARIVQEGIRVRGVPTSNASRLLAESLGISLIDLSNAGAQPMCAAPDVGSGMLAGLTLVFSRARATIFKT